jgi:hypothetical protein
LILILIPTEIDFEIDYTKPFNAPFESHRWLPLPEGANPYKTPIASTTYDASEPGWYNWAVAAQEHASFFQNLERGQRWRYHHATASGPQVIGGGGVEGRRVGGDGGKGGGTGGDWAFWAEKFSIRFVAVWGRTLKEHPLSNEDEKDLSVWLPRRLGRREFLPVLWRTC